MANCQYGCEVLKGEVRCQCPSPGLQLAPDGRTCVGTCQSLYIHYGHRLDSWALCYHLLPWATCVKHKQDCCTYFFMCSSQPLNLLSDNQMWVIWQCKKDTWQRNAIWDLRQPSQKEKLKFIQNIYRYVFFFFFFGLLFFHCKHFCHVAFKCSL